MKDRNRKEVEKGEEQRGRRLREKGKERKQERGELEREK